MTEDASARCPSPTFSEAGSVQYPDYPLTPPVLESDDESLEEEDSEEEDLQEEFSEDFWNTDDEQLHKEALVCLDAIRVAVEKITADVVQRSEVVAKARRVETDLLTRAVEAAERQAESAEIFWRDMVQAVRETKEFFAGQFERHNSMMEKLVSAVVPQGSCSEVQANVVDASALHIPPKTPPPIDENCPGSADSKRIAAKRFCSRDSPEMLPRDHLMQKRQRSVLARYRL
ncbi:uncharacterized protein LOC129338621 [Eublepharis macularius]|uniref:Uncharacterized protein LOC129338621 n=1 Tax=Eublepharis macularius TaxID=481883 RepID=A0AA97K5N0_EUBMA|nr:uncharacterized protein LOC129338621 [Eublepharis macularius]